MGGSGKRTGVRVVASEDPESTQVSNVCGKCGRAHEPEASDCPPVRTQLVSKEVDPLVDTVVDGTYRIVAPLGEGGMSVVYKARHQLLGRIVALKMLHADLQGATKSLQRFQHEGKVLSSLNHPNVVAVHDFGITPQSQMYLVMQYVEGRSLADALEAAGPLDVTRAIGIFLQVCDALTHAHRIGILHRDLKPSNIMLVPEQDGGDLVRVVDFGLAKFLPHSGKPDEKFTKTGRVCGSPLYMSPEQWAGVELDERSDIYSLGCVMYEALSNKTPLDGENLLKVMFRQSDQTPLPLRELSTARRVSPELEAVVSRALEMDRANRYSSIVELKRDLELTPEYATASASPKRVSRKPGRAGRLRRMVPVLGSIAILLAVAACALAWYSSTTTGALELMRLSLVAQEQMFGRKNPRLLPDLNTIVQLYLQKGSYRDAAERAKQAIEIIKLQQGAYSLDLANAYERLAEIYSHDRNWQKEQNQCDEEAARIFEVLANEHAKHNQAEQAVLFCEKALQIWERKWGPTAVVMAPNLIRLGDLARQAAAVSKDMQYYSRAATVYSRALEILESRRNPDWRQIANILDGLGATYFAQSNYSQAEKAFVRELDVREGLFGKSDPTVAAVLGNLESMADTCAKQRNYSAAEPLYKAVLAGLEKIVGLQDARVGEAARKLGDMYQSELQTGADPGRRQELINKAAFQYQRALSISAKAEGPESPKVAWIPVAGKLRKLVEAV